MDVTYSKFFLSSDYNRVVRHGYVLNCLAFHCAQTFKANSCHGISRHTHSLISPFLRELGLRESSTPAGRKSFQHPIRSQSRCSRSLNDDDNEHATSVSAGTSMPGRSCMLRDDVGRNYLCLCGRPRVEFGSSMARSAEGVGGRERENVYGAFAGDIGG